MRHGESLRRSRGGILLEVLISIALFAGAAGFVLSVTGNAIDRQSITLRQQQALDLAKSLMASLEAGLVTVADIRDGLPRELGSIEEYSELINDQLDRGLSGWTTSIRTQRTEFVGLSLVEITVTEDLPGGSAVAALGDSDDQAAASVTVRQLVRLRDEDVEEWETDDMLDGLPEAGGQP